MNWKTCKVCIHKEVCEARELLRKACSYVRIERQQEVYETLQRVVAMACRHYKTVKQLEKEAEK